MVHLEESRLLELGLASDEEMDMREKEHVRCCSDCRARLENERSLTDMLEQISLFQVPAHFVEQTALRFASVSEMSTRAPLFVCSISMILMTGGMFWLAVANLAQVATAMATTFKTVSTLFGAFSVVLSHLPVLQAALPLSCALTLLISAALLATLVKKEAVVK